MPKNRLKVRRNRQRKRQQQEQVRRQQHEQRLADKRLLCSSASRGDRLEALQSAVGHYEDEEVWVTLPSGLMVDYEGGHCFFSPFNVMISEVTLIQVLKEYLQIHDFRWQGYYSVETGHPIYNFLPKQKLTNNVGDCISAWSIPSFTKILENSNPEVIYLSNLEVIANQWSSFLCSFAANMRKFYELRTGRSIQYFPLLDFDINYEDALFVMSKTDDNPRSCFDGLDRDFYWFLTN